MSSQKHGGDANAYGREKGHSKSRLQRMQPKLCTFSYPPNPLLAQCTVFPPNPLLIFRHYGTQLNHRYVLSRRFDQFLDLCRGRRVNKGLGGCTVYWKSQAQVYPASLSAIPPHLPFPLAACSTVASLCITVCSISDRVHCIIFNCLLVLWKECNYNL